MLRSISEFFKPSKKCARLGHTPKEAKFTGIVETPPGSYSRWEGVANNAVLTYCICKRCKATISGPEISDRTPIHSLRMSSELWDKLRSGQPLCVRPIE